jgi:methyl-accepting chemotaxis protein
MRWTIRTRLFALSFLGLLLAMAVGESGYFGVSQVQSGIQEIYLTSSALRNHLEADMMRHALKGDVLAALLARDDKAKERVLADLADHSNRFRQYLARNNALPLNSDIKAQLQETQPVLEKYIKSAEAIVDIAFKNRATAQAQLDAFLAVFNDLDGKLSKLSDEVQASAKRSELHGQDIVVESHTTILLICGLSLLVMILVGVWISQGIVSTIQPLIESLQSMAEGDLCHRIDAKGRDEIGEVGRLFNVSTDKLRGLIAQLADTAQRVAGASEEISSSATAQAQGAESQKDETRQVATAMQEMSATVTQVAEHAHKAAGAARQAADTARQGGKIVEETLDKMRAIAGSVGQTARQVQDLGSRSDQIGEIIGVIDEIAGQTNLLALNAAIEAARAGEQGRGFAVVADEVRKLAERTSKATKEITQMIKSIQGETKNAVKAMQEGTNQVEQGLVTTAQAGKALHEIIQMAQQVGEMVVHIATAAQQQSGATEEVSGNMEQISRISQDTATGAQQTAKACHDLSGLALDLQSIVGQFKLNNGNGNGNGTYGNGLGRGSLRPSKAVLALAGGSKAFALDGASADKHAVTAN